MAGSSIVRGQGLKALVAQTKARIRDRKLCPSSDNRRDAKVSHDSAVYFSPNTFRLSETSNPKPNTILRRVAIRTAALRI